MYLKPTLNFSSREWQHNEKVAVEYCWVITGGGTAMLRPIRFSVCWSVDLNWTVFVYTCVCCWPYVYRNVTCAGPSRTQQLRKSQSICCVVAGGEYNCDLGVTEINDRREGLFQALPSGNCRYLNSMRSLCIWHTNTIISLWTKFNVLLTVQSDNYQKLYWYNLFLLMMSMTCSKHVENYK